MQQLKRDLALAQLRLRSITVGSDLNFSNEIADGLQIYVTEGGQVDVVRSDGERRRRQSFDLLALIALARIESDSPARAPVAEKPIPLAPGGQSFGGKTFDPEKDEVRLGKVLGAVRDLMSDGVWRTLDWIAESVTDAGHSATHAGISARLRDLRKPQFGGHTVERERVAGCSGLWRYRLILRATS